MRSRKLALNTIVVIAAFGADKVLALVRDWLVGRRFGAGYEYDAFTAAVQAPELLFTLIAGGALLAAFIPVFSEKLAKGPRDDAWRLASGVTNIVMLVLLTFGLVVGLFSEPITATWLVPEFPADKQALTADLLRIILLQTFIFGVAGVIVGVLHSHQHFFLPAIAPIFYNLGQIFGVIVLAPRFGISGLTWGMVLGAAGYLLIQTPALWRFGARYFPTLALRIPGLSRIGWLMVPRLVSLGLVELADVFFVRLGSRLPDGHLSAYFWGWRLMQFPETLFGTAVAQVFFPTLAELANAGDWDGLRQRANDALRVILTLTVPSAVALILLGRPLVSLIGGAFDAQAVELVHAALVIMSVRLVGEAILEIGARLFYAQQDTTTPMFAAALGQSVSIGLGYALIEPLGFRGLAVATTIGFWVESGLLLGLAHRKLGRLVDRGLLTALGRALAGSGVLGLGIWAARLALPVDGGRLQVAVGAGLAGLVGLAGYLISLFTLRSPELRAIPALLGRYRSGRERSLLDENQA
jgi:putative peptidoglycan lipid II flippase